MSTCRHPPRSTSTRPLQGLRALIASAVLALFAGSCLAENRIFTLEIAVSSPAAVADARLTELTCHIAALYSEGRIDARTYCHLHAMRSEAARSVTIWLHSGRGEHEARAALAVFEMGVPE